MKEIEKVDIFHYNGNVYKPIDGNDKGECKKCDLKDTDFGMIRCKFECRNHEGPRCFQENKLLS